jgi:hypothetical protein
MRAGRPTTVTERTYTHACGFELATEKVFCMWNCDILRSATKTYYPLDVTAATFCFPGRRNLCGCQGEITEKLGGAEGRGTPDLCCATPTLDHTLS